MADSVVEAKGFEPMTPCVQGSRNPNATLKSFNIWDGLSRGFSAAFTGLVETISDPIHEAIYG